MQSTFAGGLSEHLQAAGGVNAGIATRLQEAIKDAKDVAAVLSQDVNAACRSLTEYATTIQQQHQAGLAPGDSLSSPPLHVFACGSMPAIGCSSSLRADAYSLFKLLSYIGLLEACRPAMPPTPLYCSLENNK